MSPKRLGKKTRDSEPYDSTLSLYIPLESEPIAGRGLGLAFDLLPYSLAYVSEGLAG